jgi:hypothetical protein
LAAAVEAAKPLDGQHYQQQLENYQNDWEDWTTLQKKRKGVQASVESTYHDAIVYFNPFAEIDELGSHLHFHFKKILFFAKVLYLVSGMISAVVCFAWHGQL